MGGKNSWQSIERYKKKSYDRLVILIPKGRRADVRAFFEARGQSINGALGDMLRQMLGMTDAQWRARPADDDLDDDPD